MRTLYVVAHGEATHHTSGLVGGWYDSELTIRGLREAHRIAKALQQDLQPVSGSSVINQNPEIWSSDLKRTAQTAEVIAATFGSNVKFHHGLREKSYGEAGGKSQEWMKKHFISPPAIGDRMNHDEGLDGAETKLEWAKRVYDAVDEILASKSETQIIVTHGGSLTFITAAWIKMPLESAGYVNFAAPPASITLLREDDYWHNRAVIKLGDIQHLAGVENHE